MTTALCFQWNIIFTNVKLNTINMRQIIVTQTLPQLQLNKQITESDWKRESSSCRLSRNDQSFVTCETEISTLMTLQESEEANDGQSYASDSGSIKITSEPSSRTRRSLLFDYQ